MRDEWVGDRMENWERKSKIENSVSVQCQGPVVPSQPHHKWSSRAMHMSI